MLTPREKFVLPGVSRQTAIDLARERGPDGARGRSRPLRRLQCRRDVPHLDVALHLPGDKVNGVAIGPAGQVWGPVTRRIADAYQRFVDHDFVGQYLRRYIEGMEARAF